MVVMPANRFERKSTDHSPIRLNFDFCKKNEIYRHSWKEHLQISKTAKFGFDIFQNNENIALRSLQIYYTFILREEKRYHFRLILANVVTLFLA